MDLSLELKQRMMNGDSGCDESGDLVHEADRVIYDVESRHRMLRTNNERLASLSQ